MFENLFLKFDKSYFRFSMKYKGWMYWFGRVRICFLRHWFFKLKRYTLRRWRLYSSEIILQRMNLCYPKYFLSALFVFINYSVPLHWSTFLHKLPQFRNFLYYRLPSGTLISSVHFVWGHHMFIFLSLCSRLGTC